MVQGVGALKGGRTGIPLGTIKSFKKHLINSI